MQLIDDEATSRFLETARADLQRRLGVAGSGDSLVTAFGALTRAAAAPPPAPHPFAWR